MFNFCQQQTDMAYQEFRPRSATQIDALKEVVALVQDGAPWQDIHGVRNLVDNAIGGLQEMEASIDAEGGRYAANMTLLLQGAREKFARKAAEKNGDTAAVAMQAGQDVLAAYNALVDDFGDFQPGQWYEGYEAKIFQHWRKYHKVETRQKYEAMWEYVAGRKFPSAE